jgi:hypothetical protein
MMILGWFPEVLRGGWGVYPTYTLNPLKSVKNPIICNSLIINKLLKYENISTNIWNCGKAFVSLVYKG